MATQASPNSSERTLTPDDIISMCLEQLRNMGEIGLSTEWQPEDIAAAVTIDDASFSTASPAEIALSMSHQPTVFSVMMEGVEAWKREIKIAKLMTGNLPLLERTRDVVDQRLLAAGMSQSELDNNKRAGIRVKVGWMYKLENPKPPAPELIRVWLNKKGGKKLELIYLPLKGTITEITAILNDLSLIVDDKGATVNRGSGPWMYQLVDKANRLRQGRESLHTDADYQNLVTRLRMPTSITPSAIFFQSSTASYTLSLNREQEDEDKDEDLGEVLDEDGNPYFQPINWDTLFQTMYGEAIDQTQVKPIRASPMTELPIRASPDTRVPMQVSPMMEVQVKREELVKENQSKVSPSTANTNMASPEKTSPKTTHSRKISPSNPSVQVEPLRRSARLNPGVDENKQ